MSNQTILGKAEPTPEALADAADRGFDAVELYLERHHLDSMADTIDACQNAGVSVESIHTPHVSRSEDQYLRQTDDLAQEVGAEYLCVHSAGIPLKAAGEIEQDIDWETPHGYESSPGESLHYVENAVFEQDLEFVLDVAHLAMSSPALRRTLRTLLTKHSEEIHLVHLSDATPIRDGLGFGEGELDMSWVIQQLQREHDGAVVMEVFAENQRELREEWELRQDG